jgi:transcriptional regulator with XRE-family HTH domain
MNVKIGAKIKALRKRDNIKQERLADALGVTSQAISKWESENGYPDIEYIKPIANFFNVTTDYLFGHDTSEKQRKIDNYLSQYHKKSLLTPKPDDEQISLMRQALAEFPAEEILLLKLAEALYWKWAANGFWDANDGGGPDVAKHKSFSSWEESMKIMEELIAVSTDDSIRGQCRYWLTQFYGAFDEKDKLLAMAEKCGSLTYSKQHILAFSAWGEDGIRYKQELLDSLHMLLQNVLRPLAERAGLEKEAFAYLFNFYTFIFGEDCGWNNHLIGFLYVCYASFHRRNNNPAEALTALKNAFLHGKRFAAFADGTSEPNRSPFTDLMNHQTPDSDARSEVQRVWEQIKEDGMQALLGDNAEFVALEKEVEVWLAGRVG